MSFPHEKLAFLDQPASATDGAEAGASPSISFLLLTPLDNEAAIVLSGQLEASGLDYHSKGPVFALPISNPTQCQVLTRLKDCLSSSIQSRVKAVIAERLNDADDLVGQLMRAELLSETFDRAEVEWVRAVLEQDRIFSVFQPIVRANDATVFGYEATTRARALHSEETIGAGQLLYASQKLNLQSEFDRRARAAAIWGASGVGIHGARLFVKFDPNTIHDPEICFRSTMQAARDTGLSMDRIVFEVINSERIESMEQLRGIVNYLKSQGADVALDDSSCGSVSRQFLADLKPDYVKIDRHLVTMAAVRRSARLTFESIVALAQNSNVQVIAEGVETEDQLDVCLSAGVDYLQGFLFALPSCPPQPVMVPQIMRRAA